MSKSAYSLPVNVRENIPGSVVLTDENDRLLVSVNRELDGSLLFRFGIDSDVAIKPVAANTFYVIDLNHRKNANS
jgi:hypothetical protein